MIPQKRKSVMKRKYTGNRKALIDPDQYRTLLEYLSFRHFFRHSYSYHLDWLQMKALIREMEVTWQGVKESIRSTSMDR